MTIKLKVKRFRTRRPDPVVVTGPPRKVAAVHRIGDDAFMPVEDADGFGSAPFPTARAAQPAANDIVPPHDGAPQDVAPQDLDSIRREGLTGRQLRMARRLAQKHGLPATSDFDAVRLLRRAGLDPFQRSTVLELVTGDDEAAQGSRALTVPDGVKLPQTVKPMKVPSTEVRAEQSHIAEVQRIQQDMARRRRRKTALLAARMFFFVALPTLLAGWYYHTVATPLFAAKTEFQIQQAQPAAQAGLGSLLGGTSFATAQDSIAVQGYLQSPEAMERLNADNGFVAHFSTPDIDPIQRMADGISRSAAYNVYKRRVQIAYDPTEGIIKMEVIAVAPEKAVEFSRALIGYAEEQVDRLTQRLREDQMEGALTSFADAETKMMLAQERVVDLQEKYKILSSEVEVGLITGQIGALETQLTQDRLSLAQMQSNETPNTARMEPLQRRIATLVSEIGALRFKLTEDSADGLSIARVQSQLLVAQANVTTRQLMLASSLQAMESARVEANRQTRYLSISVNPIAPDDPAYPRAFENTLVVMLIFAGVYLMISMTVAILREQVTA